MKTKKLKIKKLDKEYEIELEVEARNVILDDAHQFLSKDKLKELESKPGKDDPVTDNTVVFTQAATRANINTGENLSTLFGKIKKYFADLKAVAFSGSYSDLTGTPALGTAALKGVSNSLTVTADGYVLDARQGYALQTSINQVNSNLSANVSAITGTWLGNNKLSFDGTNFFATASNGVKKKLGDPIFATIELSRSSTTNLGNNMYQSTFSTGITGKVLWQTIFFSAQNGVSFGGGTVEPISASPATYDAISGIITINSWYWRNDGIYVHYAL